MQQRIIAASLAFLLIPIGSAGAERAADAAASAAIPPPSVPELINSVAGRGPLADPRVAQFTVEISEDTTSCYGATAYDVDDLPIEAELALLGAQARATGGAGLAPTTVIPPLAFWEGVRLGLTLLSLSMSAASSFGGDPPEKVIHYQYLCFIHNARVQATGDGGVLRDVGIKTWNSTSREWMEVGDKCSYMGDWYFGQSACQAPAEWVIDTDEDIYRTEVISGNTKDDGLPPKAVEVCFDDSREKLIAMNEPQYAAQEDYPEVFGANALSFSFIQDCDPSSTIDWKTHNVGPVPW